MRNFVVLLGLVCLYTSGCNGGSSEPAKLKVGTVDVIRIMEERPETMDIRLDWAEQAGQTSIELSQVKDETEAVALRQEIEKRSKAWQKRMDEFMEESINLVETEASALAKEKGLDIVLVDNPLTKTIRYRDGEDLTLDVSFKLQDQ